MLSGTIFDIKKYAVHDGPGIRTTVFFKGCPLRCAWCHNPEGQSEKPEIMVKSSRCLEECEECLARCDQGAISKKGKKIWIDKKKCNSCGQCADACTTQAIELAGRKISVQEVMTEIEKDNIFHDESGGGVTFSGGEPLLQSDFLNALLDRCQARHIQTTVDTSGYAPFKKINKILSKVELFLYDLKIMDEKKHKKYTGVSNQLIINNLKRLSPKAKKIIIRIPVISGINDDEENIQQTAEFILSLKNISRLSLLFYHKLGKDKYLRLGRHDFVSDFSSPCAKRKIEIQKRFESYRFVVSRGD